MTDDLVSWLEQEGWDLLSVPADGDGGLEARRDRTGRVETVHIGTDGRLRYTVARPVGDEEFRRLTDGERQYKVVSRSYTETTVTASVASDGTIAALEQAIRAAHS